MIQLTILDWFIWMFFFLSGLGIVYLIQRAYRFTGSDFLIRAYLLKTLGGLSFAVIYLYYYEGGDTMEYFRSSATLTDILLEKPNAYFKLMSMNCEEARPLLGALGKVIYYSNTGEEWFMLKLISPLHFLGFRSYLGITFLMSLISLIGSLKLYQTMVRLLPGKELLIFRINFLIPTVLFWSSGLLKDTITFSCFAILCYYFYKILQDKKLRWHYFIILPIAAYVILQLKSYILISFSVWVFITVILSLLKGVNKSVFRYLLGTFLGIGMILLGYLLISYMLTSNQEYNTENLYSKVRGFHTWHTQLGGSAYDLGEMEYSEVGFLKKAPAAINVTLFRPYVWEANSALLLLSSLESIFMLCIVAWALIRKRLRVFSILFRNPYLFGGLIFCLIFAFSIGLTSYNFGALSRFKIPLMAIFTFLIFYCIYYETAKPKKAESIS